MSKITFNSDMMLADADRSVVRSAFPNVHFALENDAARTAFAPIDARANAAKTRSRQWGVFAVFLASAALLLAGGEMLYHGFPKNLLRAIAALGGIMGILSVVIGLFGVMFRERKMRWLTDRLVTERIRQRQFADYIENAPAILEAAADAGKRPAYQASAIATFNAFNADFQPRAHAQLEEIVHAEGVEEVLSSVTPPASIDSGNPHLGEYFDAYRKLRFERQIEYCDYVLREKGGFWKQAPVIQLRILGAVALSAVLGILILHAFVLAGAIANVAWMKGPLVHVFAIWAAIVALTAKAFEEGFQPEREIERMRHYRFSLKRLQERFESADPAGKLAVMADVERLAQEEMALFLKGNYEAQFVM